MHSIIWNSQAQENLHSIQEFYREAGVEEEIIEDLLSGIINSVERLSNHPQSGRIVPEIEDPNFKEVIWNDTWRIIYIPPNNPDEPIEILNVLHTAQKLGA